MGGRAWCSTMTDSQGEHIGKRGEWGYCEAGQNTPGWLVFVYVCLAFLVLGALGAIWYCYSRSKHLNQQFNASFENFPPPAEGSPTDKPPTLYNSWRDYAEYPEEPIGNMNLPKLTDDLRDSL